MQPAALHRGAPAAVAPRPRRGAGVPARGGGAVQVEVSWPIALESA
jgi:hypothetical protein